MPSRSSSSRRAIGQTRAVGFNVGARHTFPLTTDQAWDWVTSAAGVTLWLGDIVGGLPRTPGERYATRDGATGEVRVFEPGSHLRLTWQPNGWERASLIQVRVRAAPGGATIAFHHEHLSSARARAAMKKRWLAVIADCQALFAAR